MVSIEEPPTAGEVGSPGPAPGIAGTREAPAATSQVSERAPTPRRSRRLVFTIVGAIVVLAGVGAGVFMVRDRGGGSESPTTATGQPATETTGIDETPKPQPPNTVTYIGQPITVPAGIDGPPRKQWSKDLEDLLWMQVVGDDVYVTNGYSDTTLARLDAKSGRELWRVPVGDVADYGVWPTSSAVLINGDSELRAYDPADGKRLWRMSYPGLPDFGVLDSVFLRPIDGAPVLVADSVDSEYRLRALDPSSGRELWTQNRGLGANYILADGRLLLFGDDGLVQIDADSGKLIWAAPVRRLSNAGPAGKYVVAATESGAVSAYDAGSGQRRWTKRFASGEAGVGVLPSSRGLVVGEEMEDGEGPLILTGVDLATGERRWGPRQVGSLYLGELGWNNALVTATDSELVLHDVSSGEQIASAPLSAPIEGRSSAAVAARVAYLVEGGSDGTLAVIRLDGSMERIGSVDLTEDDDGIDTHLYAVSGGVLAVAGDRITRYG